MRKVLLFLLFGLINMMHCAFGQSVFPSFYNTAKQYINCYPGIDINELHFEKRADGWWACKKEYIEDGYSYTTKYIDCELFWNAQSNQFKKCAHKGKQTELQDKVERFMETYIAEWYDYERLPYYGYDSFATDIIRDFSSVENPSDTLLESLARAYAGLANSLFNGTINPAPAFISEEKIQEYLKNAEKSLKYYKTLLDKNPDYTAYFANMPTKYLCETVGTYQWLDIYDKKEDALKFLHSYTPPQYCIDIAKNYLNSILPNGILFTYGDIDTYLPTYVQKKLRYRTDVSIININLLHVPVYIQYLSETVKFNASPQQYKPDIFSYATKNIPRNLIGKLRIDSVLLAMTPGFDRDNYATNGEDFYIETATTKITVPFKYYFYRNEYLMFDIIQANIKTRPIYATSPYGSPIPRSLWQSQGIIYQLVADPSPNQTWAVQQQNYLTSVFKNSDYENDMLLQNSAINSYVTACLSLFSYYTSTQKTDEAFSILKTAYNMTKRSESVYASTLYGIYWAFLSINSMEVIDELEFELLKRIQQSFFYPERFDFMTQDDALAYLQSMKEEKARVKGNTKNIEALIRKISVVKK